MIPLWVQAYLARWFCPQLLTLYETAIDKNKLALEQLEKAKAEMSKVQTIFDQYARAVSDLEEALRRKEGSIQDLLKICNAQQRLIQELKEGQDEKKVAI